MRARDDQTRSIRFRGGTFEFWRGGEGGGREFGGFEKNYLQSCIWPLRKKFLSRSVSRKKACHTGKISCMHTSRDKIKIPIAWNSWKKKSCLYHIAPLPPPQKSNGSPLGIYLFLRNLQVTLLKFESRWLLVLQKSSAAR